MHQSIDNLEMINTFFTTSSSIRGARQWYECLIFGWIVSEKSRSASILPGDQEGLFKLAIQLRTFFNWVSYNTATGYVLLVYLTNI
jgi:hypothetical protein